MPSKQYGQTRSIQPKTKSIASARSAYNVAIHKPDVIAENCYFSEETGCSVIYKDGHNYHIEEMEVAQALADYGIDVTLQPESLEKGGISLKVSKKGYPLFNEGQLNAEAWYEQSTIDKSATSIENTIKKGLKHARSKGADVAIIYDRYGLAHQPNIYGGIEAYNVQKFNNGEYKFKAIITVNSEREVNFWTN